MDLQEATAIGTGADGVFTTPDLAVVTCEALHDWGVLRIADARKKPTEHERLALLRTIEMSKEFLRRLQAIPQEQRNRTRSSFEFNTEDFGRAVTFQMPAASGAGSTARGLLDVAGGCFAWAFAKPRVVQRDAGRMHPGDDTREPLRRLAVRLTHAAIHVLTGALGDTGIEPEGSQAAWVPDDAAPEYPLGLRDRNGPVAIELLREMGGVAQRTESLFVSARRAKQSERQQLKSAGIDANKGLRTATGMFSGRLAEAKKTTMAGAVLSVLIELPDERFAEPNGNLSADELCRRASLVEGCISAALAVATALNHAGADGAETRTG